MEQVLLAAISSPRRREILRLLWSDELTVGAIHSAMPDVTMGAVSLQLKALLDVGLVESRAEHRHRYYRARRERLGAAAPMLEQMWNDALWRLTLAAELEQARRGPRPARTSLRGRSRKTRRTTKEKR
jgi:DNA-binding transcriptional ArsR family regulator